MRLIPVDPGLAWRLILPYANVQVLCKLLQTNYALYSYILRNQLLIAAVDCDLRCCKLCGWKLGSCSCIGSATAIRYCGKCRFKSIWGCSCKPSFDRTVIDCLTAAATRLEIEDWEARELRTRGFVLQIE